MYGGGGLKGRLVVLKAEMTLSAAHSTKLYSDGISSAEGQSVSNVRGANISKVQIRVKEREPPFMYPSLYEDVRTKTGRVDNSDTLIKDPLCEW